MRKTIVVAHHDESVDWLDALREQFEICIMSTQRGHDYQVPNAGCESTKYLKYIIDNYASLPDHTMFIHAHEKSWHDTEDKAKTIREFPWDDTRDIQFLPTGGVCFNVMTIDVRNVVSYVVNKSIKKIWPLLFEAELGKLPNYWENPGAAQFVVEKQAILRRPKAFYMKIYDWVLTSDKSMDVVEEQEILRTFKPFHMKIYDWVSRSDTTTRRPGRLTATVMEQLWILMFSPNKDFASHAPYKWIPVDPS